MSTGTRQYPKDKSIQKEGGTTMKVWKKLATAVSMAAICCAMIVPTIANAQPCIQHVYTYTYVGTNIISAEYYVHDYTVSTELPNGGEDSYTGTCRVRLARDHYIEECMLCGHETGNEDSRDREVHMNPDCPVRH